MRCDSTIILKTKIVKFVYPGTPVAVIYMKRLEQEYFADVVECGVPTLKDLSVVLTQMED